jgi:hypothetical protein
MIGFGGADFSLQRRLQPAFGVLFIEPDIG